MKVSQRNSGVTLVELMITVAILSIGVLAAVGSFQYITASIQGSKIRTLANNLAQEQIEKLKNLSYYDLLVTTSDYSDSRFTPPIAYDTGNYPAQPLVQGGITFTRGNRVDFAYQNSGSITTVPWTSDDTGLKEITTYVMWSDVNGWHYIEMHNLMANPAANPLSASFTGTVKDTSNNPIASALVQVLDNPNWLGHTNSAGTYSFNVAPGSFTVMASSTGYFSQIISNNSATSGNSTTINFNLGPMASGTAFGYAYLDNQPVISQVVASTGTSNDIEYIELYNPTASSIYIGDNTNNGEGANPLPAYVMIVWGKNNSTYQVHHLFYVSFNIPANGYYLISNTGNGTYPTMTACSAFTVAGVSVSPDACWSHNAYTGANNDHWLECDTTCPGANVPDAGGVTLLLSGGVDSSYNLTGSWKSYIVDTVGWSKNASAHSAPSNAVKGTPIANGGGSLGLRPNEQYVRTIQPGSMSPVGYGRAYDSNNNNLDFTDSTSLIYLPYYSSTIQTPISGTPASGAYVTSNDPLSQTQTCQDTTLSGGYRVCSFSVPNIATGTWTLAVSTAGYYQEINNVVITPSLSTGVPNGATSPTWIVTGATTTLLNASTNYAFISGVVTDISNNPLPGVKVQAAGGSYANTNSNGRYFISAPAGDVQVTANPSNQNGYMSQGVLLPALTAGVIYDNPIGVSPSTWFILSYGGIIKGYFQTASNTPLPSRVAVALSGGNQIAQATSDNTGYFYLVNLPTGTYTVQPALDPMESASPASVTPVTISSTGTVTITTFTITTGMAQIGGQLTVAASGTPITTGVLVLASTSTLSGGSSTPPPSISGSNGPLCNPCYYAASSDSTGQYTLTLRDSTTSYQVYAWYTTFNGTTPTTIRQGPYSVTVSAAGSSATQNISW